MKTTQRQNVLRHLLAGPLCGVHDDWLLGRRFAARVHELRVTGFPIETRQCRGSDHLTYQIEYQLIGGRGSPYNLNDWCAHCGRSGVLRLSGKWTPSWIVGLTVECGRCGRGDYR